MRIHKKVRFPAVVFGVAIVLCTGALLFGLGRGGSFLLAALLSVMVVRLVAGERRRRARLERERLRVAAPPSPCVTVRRLGAADHRLLTDR